MGTIIRYQPVTNLSSFRKARITSKLCDPETSNQDWSAILVELSRLDTTLSTENFIRAFNTLCTEKPLIEELFKPRAGIFGLSQWYYDHVKSSASKRDRLLAIIKEIIQQIKASRDYQTKQRVDEICEKSRKVTTELCEKIYYACDSSPRPDCISTTNNSYAADHRAYENLIGLIAVLGGPDCNRYIGPETIGHSMVSLDELKKYIFAAAENRKFACLLDSKIDRTLADHPDCINVTGEKIHKIKIEFLKLLELPEDTPIYKNDVLHLGTAISNKLYNGFIREINEGKFSNLDGFCKCIPDKKLLDSDKANLIDYIKNLSKETLTYFKNEINSGRVSELNDLHRNPKFKKLLGPDRELIETHLKQLTVIPARQYLIDKLENDKLDLLSNDDLTNFGELGEVCLKLAEVYSHNKLIEQAIANYKLFADACMLQKNYATALTNYNLILNLINNKPGINAEFSAEIKTTLQTARKLASDLLNGDQKEEETLKFLIEHSELQMYIAQRLSEQSKAIAASKFVATTDNANLQQQITAVNEAIELQNYIKNKIQRSQPCYQQKQSKLISSLELEIARLSSQKINLQKRHNSIVSKTKTSGPPLYIELPKVLYQDGAICKPTALATLEYFYSTQYRIANIPLHKNHRNIYLEERNNYHTENPRLSVRRLAKQSNSKQGEVLQRQDLEKIAREMGYNVHNKQPESIEMFRELIVDNLKNSNPILTCFAVNRETGLPIEHYDKNEHACLIIGYNPSEDTVSIAHWGKTYENIALSELYKSMLSLPETRQIEKYGAVKGFGLNKDSRKYALVEDDRYVKYTSIKPRKGSGFRNHCFIIMPNGSDPRWQKAQREVSSADSQYKTNMRNKLFPTGANAISFLQGKSGSCWLLIFLHWMYGNEKGVAQLNQMFKIHDDGSISVTFQNIQSKQAKDMVDAHKHWKINGKTVGINIDQQTNNITFKLSKEQVKFIEHHQTGVQKCSHLAINIFEHIIPFFFGTRARINPDTGISEDQPITPQEYEYRKRQLAILSGEVEEPINLHMSDGRAHFDIVELCAIFNINRLNNDGVFIPAFDKFQEWGIDKPGVFAYLVYNVSTGGSHASRVISYDKDGFKITNPHNTNKVEYYAYGELGGATVQIFIMGIA